MKNFAKILFYFLLFFTLFTVLINTGYLGLIAATDWNFSKRLESLKFDNPDFEILILGTSFADYGVDAELLTLKGLKTFNLALDGSSVKTNYIQLNEYLTNYSIKPRYVLLFVNSYLEAFHQEGIQPVVEFTMKSQKIDLKDIPISKFGWQRLEILKKILSSEYRKGYVSFGQVKRTKITPDNSDYKETYISIEKFEAAHWMGEIAKLCSLDGIEFMVIEIPGISESQNMSEIGPYHLYFDNGYTANLYNLNSQDFCKFIDPNKDWVGLSHFNKFGATKFTNELINILNLSASEYFHDQKSQSP